MFIPCSKDSMSLSCLFLQLKLAQYGFSNEKFSENIWEGFYKSVSYGSFEDWNK